MSKRTWILVAIGAVVALALAVPQLTGAFPADPRASQSAPMSAPVLDRQTPYSEAWLAANHGKFDNIWTALYETQQQVKAGRLGSPIAPLLRALSPLYGVDVRMSNGNLLGSNQNEFQIDVNPTNNLNAIGTSNDSGTAGVGVFRTTDGGLTWTSRDASAYGVPASCCDPGVAYGPDGHVYVVILNTSGPTYIIRSSDGGATWAGPSQVTTPDRENVATDPSNPNIVYVTYSDLPATNRIKGYKSTDAGVTWGPSFFVGDTAPPQGYEQSSQPRVASNGWLYVGYQQYTNSTTGCSAGVQNVVARSTDGGATFTYTVLPIVQGGACSGAQAGRGIFCTTAGGSSFRSRSFPVIGVNPTNPQHVYMLYSGGDLESAYVCAGSNGFHSDTLFRLSTDGGVTFTPPAKVNTDPQGKDQYFPWMAVSENGRIWAGWNDRREDPNDFLSRWYQSYSDDEGTTWKTIAGAPGNDPVADVQTQPSTFIGDYAGLGARNGLVLGMWFDSRISASGDAYTDPQVPPVQGTPTPTVTGTPPTNTPTRTATQTWTATQIPTATQTPCSSAAIVNSGFETGTLAPWTVLGTNPAPVVSNAGPHSGTYAALLGTVSGPEPNGDGSIYQTITVPAGGGTLSYWWNGGTTDTITFDWQDAYITDTSGNILATIQHICSTTGGYINQTFNMAPYAGQTVRVEFLVHQDGFGDDTYMYVDDVLLLTACGTPGPTNTPSPTSTATAVSATNTPTTAPATSTRTAVPATSTPTVTATLTVCPIQFTDVLPNDPFYSYIRCLACRNIITGYSTSPPCGTGQTPCFNGGANITRGQVVKIVSNAAGFNDAIPSTRQTFTDVPYGSPFWLYIERAYAHGVISGYVESPPCLPGIVPCALPIEFITRGQMAKITANAAGYSDAIPSTTQTFTDVPYGSTFWLYIERANLHGLISGYSTSPPCAVAPCFLTSNNLTRNQAAKIVANGFFPNCQTPAARKLP